MNDNNTQNTAQSVAYDIAHQQTGEFHMITNPRELAAVSLAAQSGGFYSADFENKLAFSLKHSMASGQYRRVSVDTPAPSNLAHSLAARV
jgi:hypothetical protein